MQHTTDSPPLTTVQQCVVNALAAARAEFVLPAVLHRTAMFIQCNAPKLSKTGWPGRKPKPRRISYIRTSTAPGIARLAPRQRNRMQPNAT